MRNNLQYIGFNVQPNTGVPGFRVGLAEDTPSIATDMDGSTRRVNSGMSAPSYNPYAPYLDVAAFLPAQPTRVATDDYCRQIIANCRTKCSARYEALGGGLGFPWMRVCIRDCVAPSGCSY